MKSTAKTVDEYVKGLPEDRRKAISAIRKVILDNLPEGYQECMSYGMIGYVVPHSIYPKGYQCNPKLPLPFVNLGSQKNHMALYLMCIYGDAKADHRARLFHLVHRHYFRRGGGRHRSRRQRAGHR